MAVRLQDIARELNLSAMTVSRVLNRPAGTYIAPETEQRVLRAAAEMGYLPNRHARALATGRTGTVAIWISHLESSVYAQIAKHCREAVEATGMQASVSVMDWHFSDTPRRFEWPVDGILAVDPPAPDLLARLLGDSAADSVTPRVYLGSGRDVAWGGDFVRVDLGSGAAAAVNHLAAAGCRRIAYSVPDGLARFGQGNYDAYCAAMHQAALTPEAIVHPQWNMASARREVRDYIARHGAPDGVYCHNDELAMAAFRALRDLGLRVPEDVLLIGSEGSEFTEYFDPPLSTISLPIPEMCRTAWQLLQRRLELPDTPTEQITLPYRFLKRESSARPTSYSLSYSLMPNTPSIIPLPQKIAVTGNVFQIQPRTRISTDDAALPEAQLLAGLLRETLGAAPEIGEDAPEAAIRLRLDPKLDPIGPEGYTLSVTPERVEIRASARAGLFYGIQTLRQMVETGGAVPCAEIEDAPRFRWRGAMLDVSRHFLPKAFVLKFLDLLALHKMNTLQLHLTDDQGWRIEIRKYPKLTEIGSVRDRTLIGRALKDPADPDFDPSTEEFDGVRYGGFYTQDDAREIVAYAAARHITVVPEIEMPGHAQSAIAAYPELGCTDKPVEVSPRWGIHEALYKPDEPTFAFLRDVLTEIMDIFPSPYVHVGGDEAVKTQWRNSEECRAVKQSLGLSTEEELQAYFIGRMDEFLTEQGRTLVGWDEILEGGLSPGATVMSWRGEEGGTQAAAEGHDVVMAPERFTYFNHYQADARSAEPMAFRELLTLPTVYNYDPVPSAIAPDKAHHVLGTQCQFWTEYMPTTAQVEYQAFPRLSAFAEVAWTQPARKDYADFLTRLPALLARLDALGVHYRPLTLP